MYMVMPGIRHGLASATTMDDGGVMAIFEGILFLDHDNGGVKWMSGAKVLEFYRQNGIGQVRRNANGNGKGWSIRRKWVSLSAAIHVALYGPCIRTISLPGQTRAN